MKKSLNNKGFTLVELLAVIVILALIMSIAVVAMSGVIGSSEENSARRSASVIIRGVRDRIMAAGELDEGYYYFTSAILQQGVTKSPLGGNYKYASAPTDNKINNNSVEKVIDGIYKVTGETTLSCNSNVESYIKVSKSGENYVYEICLSSDDPSARYVYGNETDIANDVDTVIISPTKSNE